MDQQRKNVHISPLGLLPERPYRINKMKTVRELTDLLRREKGIDIPARDTTEALRRKLQIGQKKTPNSICIHPAEGFDGTYDGNPTGLTYRRYKKYAESGAGILWFESFSVNKEGKDHPCQLTMMRENIPEVARLIRETERYAVQKFGPEHKPYKVLQITHSGRRCRDVQMRNTPIVGSVKPYYDSDSMDKLVIADDAYIQDTVKAFVEAAQCACEAGFDAVDIKICHSYLLCDLLSAFERPGIYGGSFQNRIRAICEIVDGIRETCGDKLDVCVRMNAYDALPYPYGWGMVKEEGVMKPDLTEPIALLKILAQKGVKIASISTTLSRYAPFGEGIYAQTKLLPTDQYMGVYHLLNATREMRQAVPELLYVSAGLSWFEKMCGYVGAGLIEEGWIDIAGYSRQALANPDFASQLLKNGEPDLAQSCVLCDRCHALSIVGHTHAGCATRDEIYRELYKKYVLKKNEK